MHFSSLILRLSYSNGCLPQWSLKIFICNEMFVMFRWPDTACWGARPAAHIKCSVNSRHVYQFYHITFTSPHQVSHWLHTSYFHVCHRLSRSVTINRILSSSFQVFHCLFRLSFQVWYHLFMGNHHLSRSVTIFPGLSLFLGGLSSLLPSY